MIDRLVGYSVQLLAAQAAGLMLVDSQGQLRAVASSREDAELMELLCQRGIREITSPSTTSSRLPVIDIEREPRPLVEVASGSRGNRRVPPR